MLKIVSIMLSGILVGYIFRKYRLSVIPRIIAILICLLLFLLGVEVGCNPRIIHGIVSLGGEALLLTAGGVLGSSILAAMLWLLIRRRAAL